MNSIRGSRPSQFARCAACVAVILTAGASCVHRDDNAAEQPSAMDSGKNVSNDVSNDPLQNPSLGAVRGRVVLSGEAPPPEPFPTPITR